MDDAAITRSAIMSEPEQSSEEEPAALRSAAIEALQSAARQKDPKEFDRLTRYGLALIERARAIRQRRRGIGSEGDEPAFPGEQLTRREQNGLGRVCKSTAALLNKLWRVGSRRRTER
jgi:hypothetical protein